MAEPNAASCNLEAMAAAAVQEAIKQGRGEAERIALGDNPDKINVSKANVAPKSAAPSTPFRTDRPFISYTRFTSGPAQAPDSSPINAAYTSSSPQEWSVYSTNSASYPRHRQTITNETHGARPQVPVVVPEDVLIQITVGQGEWRTVFLVSRNRLFQKAPMLAEWLKEHLKGRSPTAALPMESPLAFEIFVRWLDRDIIINGNDRDRICKALMELFFFAERYCIYKLADNTLDAYIDHLILLNSLPLIPTLKTIWYNTQPESKFRLFLARVWTYTFVHCGKYAGWPTADFCEGVGGVQLEGLQILRASLKPDSLLTTAMDPRYAPACDYHMHDKNYPCPKANQIRRKRKQEDRGDSDEEDA